MNCCSPPLELSVAVAYAACESAVNAKSSRVDAVIAVWLLAAGESPAPGVASAPAPPNRWWRSSAPAVLCPETVPLPSREASSATSAAAAHRRVDALRMVFGVLASLVALRGAPALVVYWLLGSTSVCHAYYPGLYVSSRICLRTRGKCAVRARFTITLALPAQTLPSARLQKMQNPTGAACAAAPRFLKTLARAGSLKTASGRFLKTLGQFFSS